jgi:hypothetical protein
MKGKRLAFNEEWKYELVQNESGEYIFKTTCGGMSEIQVKLTKDGINRFEAKGEVFLRNLNHMLYKGSKNFLVETYEEIET